MVKNCLMKLGLSWMLKHKERYVLSWISFGLISMFLIFVYSIAVGITSQVKDYASAFPEGSVSVDRMNEIASQYSIAGTVIASVRSGNRRKQLPCGNRIIESAERNGLFREKGRL